MFDLAHHEIFRANVGKGGIMTLNQHEIRKLRHNRYFEEKTMDKLINRIPGSRFFLYQVYQSRL